jgi:hypothetical protein
VPDPELGKVSEEAEDLKKPQNYGYHYHGIQDPFDLTLHGNEAVDKPKQHTYYA